jgi:type VI secretion system protein ImpM
MPEQVVNNAPGAAAAAGWYGKLPGLGDFAMRRLPPEFVSRWDTWLQSGLQTMSDSTAHDGNDLAPVCRFWLAPGVVDTLAWGGLLMPSTDRAGRRFPLTVAQPIATLAEAIAARRWFSSLVAAMRFTQGIEHTLDDFEECLNALPPPLARAAPRVDVLLATAVQDNSPACSVWWRHGAASAEDFQRWNGLPMPTALPSLLGGAR